MTEHPARRLVTQAATGGFDVDKPTDATDKPRTDDDILEPEEVISDAAETAFMEDAAERENAKK